MVEPDKIIQEIKPVAGTAEWRVRRNTLNSNDPCSNLPFSFLLHFPFIWRGVSLKKNKIKKLEKELCLIVSFALGIGTSKVHHWQFITVFHFFAMVANSYKTMQSHLYLIIQFMSHIFLLVFILLEVCGELELLLKTFSTTLQMYVFQIDVWFFLALSYF